MEVELTRIEGILKIFPCVLSDNRGSFYESWKKNVYKELGITEDFVQDNLSFSKKHVLRGLHFQMNQDAQGQLISVIVGKIFDICVDIRPYSPTFGGHIAFELDSSYPTQIYMPPGIAHGFCVLSESAIVQYKCTRYFSPKSEGGILWNDPDLNIKWPISTPIVSIKDTHNLTFKNFRKHL